MPRRFPFTRQQGRHFVGIPTVEEWGVVTHRSTLGISHRRNNVLLLAIDGTVATFEAFENIPFDLTIETQAAIHNYNQITALYLFDIMSASLRWLESKQGRSSARRPAVDCLVNECCRILGGPPFTNYGIVVPIGPQRTATKIRELAARLRWARLNRALNHVQIATRGKALHEYYWLETDIGGSNPSHGQGADTRAAFLAGNQKHMLMHRSAGGGVGPSVYQVDAMTRPRYQVHFQNGRPYRRTPNGTLELVSAVAGKMFVADLNGQFYCTFGEACPNGQVWHHSSFLSGQAVGFAGGITIADGYITEIDTMSGHYKPKPKQILWALQQLQGRYGVELTEVGLMTMNPEEREGETWLRIMIFESAQKYLAMKSFLRPSGESLQPPIF